MVLNFSSSCFYQVLGLYVCTPIPISRSSFLVLLPGPPQSQLPFSIPFYSPCLISLPHFSPALPSIQKKLDLSLPLPHSPLRSVSGYHSDTVFTPSLVLWNTLISLGMCQLDFIVTPVQPPTSLRRWVRILCGTEITSPLLVRRAGRVPDIEKEVCP